MKKVYWGYSMSRKPKIGETISLTKVTLSGCSIGAVIQKERVDIGPIQEIQQIGANMSILWVEDAGYAVYYTE